MPVILLPTSMPHRPRPLESGEAYNAIVHLLEEQGIDFVCDDLMLNEVVTPSGDTLYVVIASNDIERAVKGATAWPAITLMSDYKTFALSQQQVVELVQHARRRFFKAALAARMKTSNASSEARNLID